MYILDKLWRGKLSPSEQCTHFNSEYSRLSQKLRGMEEHILAELSEEGREYFREFCQIQEQMAEISEEDSFINGFRIAVGLILDATCTYESQFFRYHED